MSAEYKIIPTSEEEVEDGPDKVEVVVHALAVLGKDAQVDLQREKRVCLPFHHSSSFLSRRFSGLFARFPRPLLSGVSTGTYGQKREEERKNVLDDASQEQCPRNMRKRIPVDCNFSLSLAA